MTDTVAVRAPGRRRRIWTAVGAAGVAGALLAGWLLVRPERSGPGHDFWTDLTKGAYVGEDWAFDEAGRSTLGELVARAELIVTGDVVGVGIPGESDDADGDGTIEVTVEPRRVLKGPRNLGDLVVHLPNNDVRPGDLDTGAVLPKGVIVAVAEWEDQGEEGFPYYTLVDGEGLIDFWKGPVLHASAPPPARTGRGRLVARAHAGAAGAGHHRCPVEVVR